MSLGGPLSSDPHAMRQYLTCQSPTAITAAAVVSIPIACVRRTPDRATYSCPSPSESICS